MGLPVSQPFGAMVAAAAALSIAACAVPPPELNGRTFAPLVPVQAAGVEPAGELVRWGGTIVEAHPGEAETCLDVVGQPLDSSARPIRTDAYEGRFRACAAGFYDPEIYAPGRRVTAVGTLTGNQRTSVGEYDLVVPQVAAEVLYLWPEDPPVYAYPYPFYGPGWGWGWGAGWGWPYAGWGWGSGAWGWRRPFYGYGGLAPKPYPRRLR